MTHKPPLPDAAVSPYPAHPAPREHVSAVDETRPPRPRPGPAGGGVGWLAIGAAIGSAAVVAGLLLARRIDAGGGKRAKPGKKRGDARKKASTNS